MVALLPVADPGEKFRVGRGQTFHFFAAVIAAHRHGDRRWGPVENSPHRSRVSPARKILYCILFRHSHSTSGGFPAVRPKKSRCGYSAPEYLVPLTNRASTQHERCRLTQEFLRVRFTGDFPSISPGLLIVRGVVDVPAMRPGSQDRRAGVRRTRGEQLQLRVRW